MDRRAWIAGLAALAPPALDYSTFPLRTVLHDDALFVAEGRFNQAPGITSWPGGLYQNTVTVANNLQVGEALTQVTLPVFYTAGTAEEGIDICGSQENTGPAELWLRALQGPNQAWQKVLDSLGAGIPYLEYVGGGTPGELSSATVLAGTPPPGAPVESYFDRMQDPLLTLRHLPAGQYQARLVKKVNAGAGDGSTNNRATYLDLQRVFTRHPTFS